MEVHTALGAAGGAGGEGDQGDIVGGGGHGPVGRAAGPGELPQIVRPVPAEGGDPQPRDPGLGEIVDGAHIAQRVPHLCDLRDRGELLGALRGQHGHRHRPGLHHGEPAGGQPGRGGPAQQDPVARQHPQRSGERMGDRIDLRPQLPVRPDRPVRVTDRGPVGSEPRDGAVQQLRSAVQPVGIAQIGEVRPLVGGRQPVAREGVGVGRGP